MAKTPAEALKEYRNKIIRNAADNLQLETNKRKNVLGSVTFVKPEEKEKLTASEILKEMKAADELEEYQSIKQEMDIYNIPGSVKSYNEQKARDRARSANLERIDRDIKKERRKADLKKLDTDIQALEKQAKSTAFPTAPVTGFNFRDVRIKNVPKNQLRVSKAEDIPFRFNDNTSGKYDEGNFYIKNSTVEEIISESGLIEKYDLQNKMNTLFKDFYKEEKFGDTTETQLVGENTEKYQKAVQDLVYEIAKKDANFRNFYKIKLVDSFESLVDDGYKVFRTEDGKTYRVKKPTSSNNNTESNNNTGLDKNKTKKMSKLQKTRFYQQYLKENEVSPELRKSLRAWSQNKGSFPLNKSLLENK